MRNLCAEDRESLRRGEIREDHFVLPGGSGMRAADFLDPEEEADLVQRAKDGDASARAKLLRSYDPIVAGFVGSNWYDSAWYEDLLQEGRAALLDALEGFDPEHGTRFGAYARTVVRRRVSEAAAHYFSPTTLNRDAARFQWRWRNAERATISDLDEARAPTFWEVLSHYDPEGCLDGEPVHDLAARIGRLRHDPERRLQAWAGSGSDELAELKAKAGKLNEAAHKAGALLTGEQGEGYATELDDMKVVGKKASEDGKGEEVLGHNTIADPSATADPEEIAERRREQERAEHREEMIGEEAERLTDAGQGFSLRMLYVVRASLDLDGKGRRTAKEIAAELTELTGSNVTPYSVRRTVERAGKRIRKSFGQPSWGFFDPFTDAEPEGPKPGYMDPFESVDVADEAPSLEYLDPFAELEKQDGAAASAAY